MDLYLARAINYANRYGKDKYTIEKYLKHRQAKQNKQTEGTEMQQLEWFCIDDPHNNETHYVRISEIESISHIGWKNNNPDSTKVIIRTKSGNKFVVRQEWDEKGQLQGDVYDTFVSYVKRLGIEE